MTNDWKNFIDEIVSARFVVSSSLHGLILAEAYGVPCVMLKNTESSDLFKYKDYYYSTGRKHFFMANSVEEALEHRDVEVPDLRAMQESLLENFALFS